MARRKKKRFISATIPEFNPDYPSLIQNDPTYHQFHLGQQAASEAEKGGRNRDLASALINFGALPQGPGLGTGAVPGLDLGDFRLTQEQINAIAANTQAGLSTTAGIERGHNREVQNLQDVLASRGMLRSGTLGVGLNQEQTRYAGEQSSERQKLLNALALLQQAFTESEGGRASDDATALGEATARQQALHPARASRRVRARRVGNNLYMDASGNYYDRNGNPVQSGDKPPHGRPNRPGRPHGSRYAPPPAYGGGRGRYDG